MKRAPGWVCAGLITVAAACGSKSGDSGSTASATTGTSGATTTTTGGGANCQQCVACAKTQCAAEVTTCEGNADCKVIWDCAQKCQMTLNDCIMAHTAGATTWGPTVASCANQKCTANGCPY
jgi:hypothetical protein